MILHENYKDTIEFVKTCCSKKHAFDYNVFTKIAPDKFSVPCYWGADHGQNSTLSGLIYSDFIQSIDGDYNKRGDLSITLGVGKNSAIGSSRTLTLTNLEEALSDSQLNEALVNNTDIVLTSYSAKFGKNDFAKKTEIFSLCSTKNNSFLLVYTNLGFDKKGEMIDDLSHGDVIDEISLNELKSIRDSIIAKDNQRV